MGAMGLREGKEGDKILHRAGRFQPDQRPSPPLRTYVTQSSEDSK